MRGDKWTPQPECSLRAAGNQQLQSCAVVKAFSSLKRDKRGQTERGHQRPFVVLMFISPDSPLKISAFVLKTAIVTDGKHHRPF